MSARPRWWREATSRGGLWSHGPRCLRPFSPVPEKAGCCDADGFVGRTTSPSRKAAGPFQRHTSRPPHAPRGTNRMKSKYGRSRYHTPLSLPRAMVCRPPVSQARANDAASVTPWRRHGHGLVCGVETGCLVTAGCCVRMVFYLGRSGDGRRARHGHAGSCARHGSFSRVGLWGVLKVAGRIVSRRSWVVCRGLGPWFVARMWRVTYILLAKRNGIQ